MNNLQRSHDSGYDDVVFGDIIIPDEGARNSSNEPSEREEKDFIVPDDQCGKAE